MSPASSTHGAELLDPGLMARLERVQLSTRRRLAGNLPGEHRSPRHGSSLDFADFRDYYPGDDMRRLDLNALARLDRLLIKLFDAEDELTLRLLIDTSRSMEGPKMKRAAQLGAALGFAALIRRDVVTVHSFPFTHSGPRFRGRSMSQSLFDTVAGLEAGGQTPFVDAANQLLTQPGPPGLTVLISDLLTPEWDTGVRRLKARDSELMVLHVLDPSDLDPGLEGDLELVDNETGVRLEVSLSPPVLTQYRALAHRWQQDVASTVRTSGGAYLLVKPTDDLETVLLGRARDQGILR